MKLKSYKMDNELRMCAYYYCFEPTGIRCIDEILSAVAMAGKGFHSTEDWGNPLIDYGSRCEFSYVELIQEMANRAAKQFKADNQQNNE